MSHEHASVSHAVIPAAGFGTRFLPWAKAVPKEMIPLGNKPVIHHVVAEAKEAGFRHMIIVISKGKEAIRSYFDQESGLLEQLEKTGKSHLLEEWRLLCEGLHFSFVYQAQMRGLGDAVLCGARAVGDQPFAVLLGDTVIAGASPLAVMAEKWQREKISSVAVQTVSTDRATRYGVCGGRETSPGWFGLEAMLEKPAENEIPATRLLNGSRVVLAFAARYVFGPKIITLLEKTAPGRNGEVQLTDAMESLRREEGFLGCLLKGHRLDIGTPEGLPEAWEIMQKL